MQKCPCGLEKAYSECCGLYIDDLELPTTPEQLMRSRYTAYSKANIDYIERTMKAPALNGFNARETTDWAKDIIWLRLEVVKSAVTGQKGTVEFKVHFRQNNRLHMMHEISEFRLDDGIWYYIDGKGPSKIPNKSKPGRNDPCPCQSNKKYKKCCGVI